MAAALEHKHWTTAWLKRAFAVLFFVTPLLFLPFTYELFEFNKMIFVYLMTTIIAFLWGLKVVRERALVIRRTPLDIPLLIYLAANIVTTVTSIDRHTSIFGYYSRFNGGLLSTFCYIFLYFAFTSNIVVKERVFSYLKVCLASTALVSLYALLERLGIDKNYWVQDVQARVFSTFGQPNWLAAWLVMVLPFNVYFFVTAKTTKTKVVQLLLFALNYLAFTFTYSRGGMLGFVGGTFATISLYAFLWRKDRGGLPQLKSFLPLGIVIVFSVFLFGNALIRESQFNGVIKRPVQTQMSSDTQLATPGTESSKIRLIVWKGALTIFAHNPLFGSGVETFAYAYYQYRPQAHNYTTEWDFLYNKAHNEYLNELATKGLVGFIPYMVFIGAFLFILVLFFIKRIVASNQKSRITNQAKIKKNNHDSKFMIHDSEQKEEDGKELLSIVILASYIAYLIQNFFGFSVVAITVLFYLLPAFYFVSTGTVQTKITNITFLRAVPTRVFVTLVIVVLFLYGLLTTVRFWIADIEYAKGFQAMSNGDATEAYIALTQATYFNSAEPLYYSYLGFVASHLAEAAHDEKDAALYDKLFTEAKRYTETALSISPRNTSILRTTTKTYTQLAVFDSSFEAKALETAKRVVAVSPTEPHDRLRLAQLLAYLGKPGEAKPVFQEAIALKTDYKDAHVDYAQYLAKTAETADATDRNRVLTEAIDTLKYSLDHIASPDAEVEGLIASYSSQL